MIIWKLEVEDVICRADDMKNRRQRIVHVLVFREDEPREGRTRVQGTNRWYMRKAHDADGERLCGLCPRGANTDAGDWCELKSYGMIVAQPLRVKNPIFISTVQYRQCTVQYHGLND
jgi:hypothetical protein